MGGYQPSHTCCPVPVSKNRSIPRAAVFAAGSFHGSVVLWLMSVLSPLQVSGRVQSPAAHPGGLLRTPGLLFPLGVPCPEVSLGMYPLLSPLLSPGAGPQHSLLHPPPQTPGHRALPTIYSTLGLTRGEPPRRPPIHLVSGKPGVQVMGWRASSLKVTESV